MIPFVFPTLSLVGSQVLACFTSAACFCTCKVLSLTGSTSTRIMYAVVFLLNATFAWLMMTDWAVGRLKEWTHGYLYLNCPSGKCYGILAVHRWCFALSIFHVILGALLIGVDHSKHPRAALQNGWWGPKILLWMGLVALSFFIPNGFFELWGNYVAMVGSALFILIQLVLLVDMAHHWCELCLSKWENEGRMRWQWLLVGSTGTLFLVTLVLTGLLYGFFSGSGCHLNQFFITMNLLLCILASVCAVHPAVQDANPKSGLAQAAVVAIYTTYLVTSAIVNEPTDEGNAHCNPLARSRSTQTTAVALGAVFTLVAIVYSTSRAATQGQSLINAHDYDDENTSSAVPLLSQVDGNTGDRAARNQALMHAVESGALPASALHQSADSDEDSDENDDSDASSLRRKLDDERHGVAYNYSFFHFIFAVASMYTAMLLTSWNTVDISDSGGLTIIGRSSAAVWMKILSGWICMALYIWTLIGPAVLPDREWS
ncbi:Membrane protein tms1 [Dispira parvispora]|uniref:Membrane protein tms1 n=1 Tax=Dispira parvispora TaxID=1520584 RepID=A0A9W8ASR7_9FUNG|nr:Membrane protein tms1 [Dispira parvispora]